MTLVACGTTVPIMNIDNNVWFRGNDCAAILNYKDPKRAVKRHVDPEWQQTLQGLLDRGGTADYQSRSNGHEYGIDDLCNTKMISVRIEPDPLASQLLSDKRLSLDLFVHIPVFVIVLITLDSNLVHRKVKIDPVLAYNKLFDHVFPIKRGHDVTNCCQFCCFSLEPGRIDA